MIEVRKTVRVVKAFIICRIDGFNLGRLVGVGVVSLVPGMRQMIKSEGMTVPYLSPHYDARNAKAQFRQAYKREVGVLRGLNRCCRYVP